MYRLLDSIIDSKRDETSIIKKDMYVNTKSVRCRMRESTVGWKLLAQWKDGSQNWIPLKILKEHNPIEAAEFLVATEIDDEPECAYWVTHVI